LRRLIVSALLQGCSLGFLADLSRHAPLLPGADVLAFLDMDSAQERVYGHAKQGAAFGHTKIQGKTLLVRPLRRGACSITQQAKPPSSRCPHAGHPGAS
jgi:hypothetical protein